MCVIISIKLRKAFSAQQESGDRAGSAVTKES